MSSISITRGDDETVRFTVKDPNDDDALVDLTGCSLWFYVKASSKDVDLDALIAKGPADVVVDVDQITNKGEAALDLVPADTAAIDRKYLDRDLPYEVQLKDGSGRVSTVTRGTIIIKADLVRTTAV